MSQGDFQADNPYASFGGVSVADSPADERVAFIRKTYTHLAMAIYAFAALEWFYFTAFDLDAVLPQVFTSPWVMVVFLVGFLVVSFGARYMAQSRQPISVQYAGLALFVVFESLIFLPMLWYSNQLVINVPNLGGVGLIPMAGIVTLLVFGGLTAYAWMSRTDFSFLGAGLGIAVMAAIALAIGAAVFGFHLGVWFSVAMVALASGYILYDTSNIIHHHQPGEHVAASLELFASVAMLFYYVLRILMMFASDD